MNQSAQLFSRARSVIPGGVNSPVRAFRNVDGDPFFVQSAKGAYITDADGRQLIDYIGTWGPAILGHAPQPVLDAVHAAVDRGLGYGIPAPAEVDMAEMITDMVPSVEKVRMVNSGTEATMFLLRLPCLPRYAVLPVWRNLHSSHSFRGFHCGIRDRHRLRHP